MKLSAQQKRMGDIAGLLSQNLSYIYGERESGPNGVKKDFLRISALFLRQLGKDLGFADMKILKNPAGIATSGDVTLYGIWRDGNGISFALEQNEYQNNRQFYREIENLEDCSGEGISHSIPLYSFTCMDYEKLKAEFLAFNEGADVHAA